MSTVANRMRAERLRRFERRRQHRADRVEVGLPHDGHGRRPDLGRGRFDLAVALLFGWTGAVSNRHDRESSTADGAGGRETAREASCRSVEGKVAVVTGGANGIGLAMGRHFAEHGMSVMLADIQPEPLDEAVAGAAQLTASTWPGCVTDVTKLASVEHLADETVAHVRRGARGVQQRGYRSRRPDDAVGVRGERLALVPRRQRARHRVGDQGVRAAHDRGRRRGPHREHVVGERRDRADGRRGDLRDVEERGDDAHRVALLPAAHAGRRSCRARCCIPGPNWLRTKLWEAWRTRPDEYAKTTPRTTAYPSFEEFEQQMEAAGTPLPVTPLEEVAGRVLDAILADQFWINPGNDEPLDARYASMKARRNPDYFRNWNPTTEPVSAGYAVRAVVGRGLGRDLGAVEVGERADAEPAVASRSRRACARRAARSSARGCSARSSARSSRRGRGAGSVAAVRLAVVRREPVDAHRVARGELGRPTSRASSATSALHDAAIVDGRAPRRTPPAIQRQPDSTLQSSIATRIDMTRPTPGYATLSWCGLNPAPPGCL